MRSTCGTLCVGIGGIGMLLALTRTIGAAISITRMLQPDLMSVSAEYWIWMPTGVLQDWLFPVGFLLVGIALLSKDDPNSHMQPPS